MKRIRNHIQHTGLKQVRIEVKFDGRVVILHQFYSLHIRPCPDEVDDVVEESLYIDHLPVQRQGPAVIEKVVDKFIEAVDLLPDTADKAAEFLVLRPVVGSVFFADMVDAQA